MPLWPLIATLAAQTLATMALFSLPAIAPAVAGALRVPGELVGVFVSVAYGVGIVSALLSPGFIHRYGGVRAMQAVLVAAGAMLLIAAGGSVALASHRGRSCWVSATARRRRQARICWCRTRRHACSTW